MTVETKLGPTVYILALTPPEREQVLAALEYAIATGRGEPERAVLLFGLDAEQLDTITDTLFLAGVPS
jgi:hypothetical protein